MTVKVINRGPDFDTLVYRVQCGFCRSIIEFLGSDAVNERKISGNYKTLGCPVCGCEVSAQIWVETDHLLTPLGKMP